MLNFITRQRFEKNVSEMKTCYQFWKPDILSHGCFYHLTKLKSLLIHFSSLVLTHQYFANSQETLTLVFTMMTSSNGNIFRVTGHLCGEFTGPRWIPRTKASDAELWCFLWSARNKRLSKQGWSWWFETLSCSLWRHRNDLSPELLLRCMNPLMRNLRED